VDAESGKTYTVINPATEEEVAQGALGGTKEQLAEISDKFNLKESVKAMP
jgi:acyl-CoA reductase-like NAD-dependent aldehyde dehydrogenase